jgi:hypothetical protein
MAETKRVLSKLSLANIFQTYNISNRLAFTVNLLQYLVLIKDNTYKIDAGYKYRIYFYRYILSIQYNTSQSIWDRMLYLLVRKASNGLDYSDIVVFSANAPTSTMYTLIDTIEYILYKYQDTTLSNVQDFPNIFSITRNSSNDTFINGQLVTNGNVRVALYKLSACAIKTIISNSILYSNIVNDNLYDPSVTNDDSNITNFTSQLNDLVTQLTALTTNVNGIDSRLTNLQNGLLVNDTNDVSQLGQITQLQLTKVNTSTTVNGHRLDSNITLNKTDIGLGNVDNTSDMTKPISTAQQAMFDSKLDKSATINGIPLNSSSITLTAVSMGLGNVDNTSDMNKPVSIATQSALAQKVDRTTSINNQLLTGNVMLTKFDINLGNCDNTADLAKPVSTATQLELNSKVSQSTTVNNKPLASNIVLDKNDIGLDQVDNTNDMSKPVSLSHQFALNLKADKSLTINTYPLSSDITLYKADVGLANVDNTSDINKPVSTAQQNSLDLKVDKTLTINSHQLNSNIVLTKDDIGLDQCDNTSDMSKPVSYAQQVKLDVLGNSVQVLSDLCDTKVDKFNTINGYSLTSNIVLSKNDIADMDMIDNTSDADKPLSTASLIALALKEDKINKNMANGYAGLDASGRLSLNVMPPVIGSSLIYLGTWNAQANVPQIQSGQGTNGQYYKVNTNGTTNIDGVQLWAIGDWIIYNGNVWQRIVNTENVNSVNGRMGNVVIVKSDIGLDQCDNTSDANKPVSIAQQTSIDFKIDKISPVLSAGNFAQVTLNGNLVDSAIRLNDSVKSSTNLWTSNHIYSCIQNVIECNLPDFNFSNFSPQSSTIFGNPLENYTRRFVESESRTELLSIVPTTNAIRPYTGSVYSPFENRVYFIPYNQSLYMHYIDCTNGQIASLSLSGLVQGAYIGGAYSPTLNRIYMAPYNQTGTLHYIDCTNGTIGTYTCNTQGVNYLGAVFSPKQNRIYFIAHSAASTWIYIDCANNGSVESYSHGVSYASQTFASGVYSPTDDRIYMVPYALSSNWYFIDCTTMTPTLSSYTSGTSIVQGAYIGGVYSPENNSIYFVPYMQRTLLHVYNCTTHTISTYPYSSNFRCAGGVYTPGRIYFIPIDSQSVIQYVKIRQSNFVRSMSELTLMDGSYGATFVPSSNRIYLAPYNQNYWYSIRLLDNSDFSISLASGALFNKL